jgi:hypothetical protein
VRVLDERESARRHELWKISHETRHGIVDGVEFDLRSSDLDPRKWGMEFLGNESVPQRREGMPFIWYPWDGEFDVNKLRQEFRASDIKWDTTRSESEFELDLAEYTPEFIVSAGDRIEIDTVLTKEVGGGFEHEHDRFEQHAFLRIVRNSQSFKLDNPLIFVGVSAIRRNRVNGHILFFDKIATRAFDYFAIKDFADSSFMDILQRDKHTLSGSEKVLRSLYLLYQENNDIINARYNLEDNPEASLRRPSRLKSIEEAIALGFHWAEAEAEMNMKPLAESGARSKRGGSIGGVRSGSKPSGSG